MTVYRPFGRGFTIVELLIVTTVIGILAAITIVSYFGVTNKANDASVQNDMDGLGKAVNLYAVTSGAYPTDATGLSSANLKVNRNSYGNDLISGGQHYNALYCSTVSGYSPTGFAIVASSKSGNVYAYRSASGNVGPYSAANWNAVGAGWGTICPDALGVSSGNSNVGVWLYESGSWKSWVQ